LEIGIAFFGGHGGVTALIYILYYYYIYIIIYIYINSSDKRDDISRLRLPKKMDPLNEVGISICPLFVFELLFSGDDGNLSITTGSQRRQP